MRRNAGCARATLASLYLLGQSVIAPAQAQSPPGSSPVSVPGVIEAEDFDGGGEGVGYHDAQAGNSGGEYRTSEDVDIVAGPAGGFVVNNIETGEWLSYTIDVTVAGRYVLELNASSRSDFPNRAYRVELDGQDLAGSITLADSGGWANFQWLGETNLDLSSGMHNLRIVADRQYFNLDAIRLSRVGGSQELMPGSSASWTSFSARPQAAPGTAAADGQAGYVLSVYGNGAPNEYGGWRTGIQGLTGDQYYRLKVRARPSNIESLRESISIVLRWRGNFGDEVSPDYVWDFLDLGDGTVLFDRVIQAPPGTNRLDLELVLQWAAGGAVDFGELSLVAVPPPPSRPVRVGAVYYRPAGTASGPDSVQQAADYGAQVAAQYSPDILVFGELLNVIGAPGALESKAESVPGNSTGIMSALARTYNVNVVFGMLEQLDGQLYNTSVLIDRGGAIAGKYHKVQLPIQDASAGITPGDNVPVFDLDIGRVALLICQDISFPEPAREAALNGAELILLPIWGGKADLVQARALENGIYLASSGYNYASDIFDPQGDVLDRVGAINGAPGVAIADIDLSRRFREIWLGDWRDIVNKERRSAPYHYTLP